MYCENDKKLLTSPCDGKLAARPGRRRPAPPVHETFFIVVTIRSVPRHSLKKSASHGTHRAWMDVDIVARTGQTIVVPRPHGFRRGYTTRDGAARAWVRWVSPRCRHRVSACLLFVRLACARRREGGVNAVWKTRPSDQTNRRAGVVVVVVDGDSRGVTSSRARARSTDRSTDRSTSLSLARALSLSPCVSSLSRDARDDDGGKMSPPPTGGGVPTDAATVVSRPRPRAPRGRRAR